MDNAKEGQDQGWDVGMAGIGGSGGGKCRQLYLNNSKKMRKKKETKEREYQRCQEIKKLNLFKGFDVKENRESTGQGQCEIWGMAFALSYFVYHERSLNILVCLWE